VMDILDGIQVVDLSHGTAGPVVGMFLADFGAEVIKAGTATYLQTGEIVRYPGRPPAPSGGRDYLGADPFDRYYQASDGWVRLHAPRPRRGPAGRGRRPVRHPRPPGLLQPHAQVR